jgi:branched-subunit amino acid aminotransferase/4-amino-4-deoxychorismate lyase
MWEKIKESRNKIIFIDCCILIVEILLKFFSEEIQDKFLEETFNIFRITVNKNQDLNYYHRFEGFIYSILTKIDNYSNILNANNFLYLIELQPITEKGYQWNKKGLIVDIYSETRKDFGYLSKYKTINCLPYVLAGIAAQALNVDSCILLNTNDNIVEATNSNLFFVKDNMLFTPAIQDGCTDGVMRKVVIQIAQQLGIKVYENKVPLQSLAIADEIFLTNSTTGIQWVVGYRGKRYFSRVARLIYDELQKQLLFQSPTP